MGRQNHTFREIAHVAWVTGTGDAKTFDIPLEKAPTNGQCFQLTDYTAGEVVAISDPVRY